MGMYMCLCVYNIQVCPVNNQSLVLGVLVDLCENPKVLCVYVCMCGRLHRSTCTCTRMYMHICSVERCMLLQAIPHVVAWGGREKSVSSWSLLASLWRQEETDMGVPRGDAGTLAGQLFTTYRIYVYVYTAFRHTSRNTCASACTRTMYMYVQDISYKSGLNAPSYVR